MFSAATIQNISDVAAYRASKEGRVPLPVWKADDITHVPFLGSYIPRGYRAATWDDLPKAHNLLDYYRHDERVAILTDATGFDNSGPALSAKRVGMLAELDGQYWGIIEQGQFQVILGAFVKDDDEPGEPAPEPYCDRCFEVHNDFEECSADSWEDSWEDDECLEDTTSDELLSLDREAYLPSEEY